VPPLTDIPSHFYLRQLTIELPNLANIGQSSDYASTQAHTFTLVDNDPVPVIALRRQSPKCAQLATATLHRASVWHGIRAGHRVGFFALEPDSSTTVTRSVS
jgi:hypothetical protein